MMASMCALAVLAACSETSEELVPEVKGEGVYATIEQPVSVDTKSLAYENGKLVFTWAEGEKVVVFGNKDAASFNSLTSGETSTKLESEGFTLKDNVNYYACLPAYTIPAATQSTSVPVTFMGQRQTANGNSDHLKSFDYACASATKAEGKNTISFELKNQVAWIVLDHTFTDATNNVTSVTINADEDLFVTKGTLDVTTSTITEGTKDRKITLNLGEEGGNGLSFAAGEAFRGFFTLNPVDLSGKTLTFTATTKSGETVALGTFTKASANLTKNLAVRIQTSGSAKVATVGGKEYSTLSAALAAASEEATISVVSDVTTEKVLIDKSVTFDLGGHTVTADDDVFYIAENDLTVNFKNGNIVSTKYGGLFFKQGRQNENITFDNCNITGVEGAIATSTLTGSTITINGGTFTSSNNAVILTNGNKRMYPYDETNTALREKPNTITINGGTFKGQMSDEAYNDRNSIACGIYAAWKDIIIVNDGTFEIERGVGVLCRGGKVTIKGGTFTTTDPDTKKGCVGDSRIVVPCQTVYVDKASQYPDYENATIEISGGKFSDDSCKDYLAEGHEVKQDGETYTVVEATVIPVTSQEDLNNAITTGATQGQSATVTLPSNSTFTLNSGIAHEGTKSRDITFVGDGTQTIDVITNAITSSEGEEMNYQRGSSFTFKNMTIQAGTTPYGGIVCDELTYVKCTIKGKLTLYGKATFVDCTFENDMADQYSIWTWGGTDVKFEGCTFNTNDKAILLYGRATAEKPTNLTVTNCTFNDRTNGSHGKAAIEIGNDYNATYNLTVSGCTVNGFAVGKNTGSTLWANKNSMDAAHLSVTIDGTKVQ